MTSENEDYINNFGCHEFNSLEIGKRGVVFNDDLIGQMNEILLDILDKSFGSIKEDVEKCIELLKKIHEETT